MIMYGFWICSMRTKCRRIFNVALALTLTLQNPCILPVDMRDHWKNCKNLMKLSQSGNRWAVAECETEVEVER
jgi:hypothetical protein